MLDAAAEEYLRTTQRTDVVGSAWLVVCDSQSPFVSALLNLDDNHDEEVLVLPSVGYIVPGIGGPGWRKEQELSIAEVAVRAAKSVFEQHFPLLPLKSGLDGTEKWTQRPSGSDATHDLRRRARYTKAIQTAAALQWL